MQHFGRIPALLAAGALVLAVAAPAGAAAVAPLRVTTDERALQPGELVVVDVASGQPVAAVQARIFGRTFAGYERESGTWRVLVGIDLDVQPGTYTLAVSAKGRAGPLRTSTLLRVRSKKFPTRRLSVDDAFVNPPPAVTDRILREARVLDDTWKRSTADRLWTTAFVRPVPQASNSAFGTRSVYNGQPRSPHGGADFPSPTGTPIKAPNAGRVVLARDLYFTGNTVVIDHGLGLYSVLAHMSKMDVSEGDAVEAGQIIGKVGATGRVTGPHLHWGIRLDGARIDPLSFLALLGH